MVELWNWYIMISSSMSGQWQLWNFMIKLMKSVVKARENQDYFAPGAFHVVSINNILTLCRDMPRLCVILWENDWHGTSLQCVEPNWCRPEWWWPSQVQDDTAINMHMESPLLTWTLIDKITSHRKIIQLLAEIKMFETWKHIQSAKYYQSNYLTC